MVCEWKQVLVYHWAARAATAPDCGVDKIYFRCYASFQHLLKVVYAMSTRGKELEERAGEALQACLADVPFLKVVGIEKESSVEPPTPDLLAEVETPEGRRLLFIEVKYSGQPRLVREAANEFFRYRAALPEAYGVLVAPYVSPEAAELCSKEGIGYVDLAGNCRLSFGTVYVRREGNPNPSAQKRDLRSLYSPRASRVLRVLLLNTHRTWKLQELAREAQVSLGQTYNVKKLLADREWIRAAEGGFTLTAPDQLLSEWAENYDFRRNQAREFYSLRSVSEIEYDLAEACYLKGIRCALTGFSGAARYAPFVRYQRATAYVDNVTDELVELLRLKPVTSGANVSLLVPYDEGVYYRRQTFAGAPVVSPVQAYLDLQGVQGRGEEAADALLKGVIRPRWKQPE